MKNSPNITVRLAKSQFARAAILEKDLHPTLEGLNETIAVQATWDSKAAKAKAEDFVDLRLVNFLSGSVFSRSSTPTTHQPFLTRRFP